RFRTVIEILLEGPAKNALGTRTMTHLLDRLRDAAGAPVLLRGAGDSFSAGLNLREVAALDERGMERFLRQLEECFAALYLYPGPTVACINGHAIAGGCVLALCCDHRVASSAPEIKIGLNEVALGLRFPPRTLAIVRDRVPRRHRAEVFLGAGLFSPARALDLGLLDEVVDDAPAVAHARLAALAAHPAKAYADT